MSDTKTRGIGSPELAERELERRREREEAGLEPERHTGPRQNEGISSAGRLYATQEEADAARSDEQKSERGGVDRAAAHVHGDEPTRE